MNTNDRGQNLAEAKPILRRIRQESEALAESFTFKPPHGGYPDPRCACAGTGWVLDGGETVACPDHVRARPVPVSTLSDPRGLPDVDWECVAGRALADLQTVANELKRLRKHMPKDVLRAYDHRYNVGA